jgi:hypothetical protein
MTGPQRSRAAYEIVALCVTNLIKLGGLFLAIHEVLTQVQPRLAEIGVALFMMTGAQVSEEAVLKLAGRMFGMPESKPPEDK